MVANVFNIERFATEDGHGIRTVVFLKGCDLRCRWCANPESQSFSSEVLVNVNTCVQCGKCEKICPRHAIQYIPETGYITNVEKCNVCGTCVKECFMDARKIMGTKYTVEELMNVLLADEQYYKKSGGGVTFSGGEPLYYSSFIKEIAKQTKERGYNTLIETCGQIPRDNIKEVADVVDFIFFDFKHFDSEVHKKLTGKGNEQIIENLLWTDQNFKGRLVVRYPFIPNCNDDDASIKKFLEFTRKLSNVEEIVFLPYHRLGLPKYKGLGRTYEMGEMRSLKKVELQHAVEIAEKTGVKVCVR